MADESADALNLLQEKHQQNMASQQILWISVLTILTGSQVMFALKEKVLGILGIAEIDPTAQLIDNTLWIIIGIGLVLAAWKLIWTFMRSKIDSRKLKAI